MPTSIHTVRCKLIADAIAFKLDGGWCACPSANECCMSATVMQKPEHAQREANERLEYAQTQKQDEQASHIRLQMFRNINQNRE